MSQILRCSPQPVGIDDVRDATLHISDGSVTVDGQDDSLYKDMHHYFPQSTEDPLVVASIKAQLVPAIVARQNVVALFYGHSGSGKTCLTEQVLPAVLEGLKTAVVSADEAYQEAMNMGMEDVSVRRSMSPSTSPLPNKTSLASPTPSGQLDSDTNVAAGETKREARKSLKSVKSSLGQSARGAAQSKYSLMLARMPRNTAAVEMAHVDSRAIGSPRPLLPRLQSVIPEVVVSPQKDDTASPSRWRQILERAKSPIALAAGSLTSLGPKNGRSLGDHLFPNFVGESRLSVEPVHELDKVLKDAAKALSISFWVQVDDPAHQQCLMHFYDAHEPNYCVSVLANTNDMGLEEAGCTLVTIRDSHGKRMESAFNTNMEDGRWHFVDIQVSPGDKTLQMIIDDKVGRVKASVIDNVSSFHDQRPKVGIIGAYSEPAADGTRNDTALLKGSIMDLMFTEMKSGKRVAGYNLRSSELGVQDVAFTMPNLEGPVEFLPRYFPQTSPSFDGYDRFVNLGQIGDLGLMVAGTKIDVTFRTSITNEKMCLMGVSDSVGKHPGFGIELNTNAHNQLQRYMVSFWLQDRHGQLVRATSEMGTAFDDRWHTISITIVDNDPAYKFKVRLDGRHCECTVFAQGLPKEFGSFTQFVSLGGFHQKGDIWRHFKGSIKFASVSRIHEEVEEPLATWQLNEGPGAVIAMDATSHGLCGVYYVRTGVKGSHFFPTDSSTGGDIADESTTHKGTTRYNNNMVSMAFCEIRTEIDAVGAVREFVVNLLTGRRSNELETVPFNAFNPRSAMGDHRVFHTIQEEWYQRVVPNDYMSVFKSGLARMEDSATTHTVFVLRLGDASFTCVDLASLKKSPKAIFSPTQLTWSDAVAIYGNENKIHFSINSSLAKLDKLLLKCGSRPQLFKRSIMQRTSTKVVSDNMLVNVLAFALLASQESAQLMQCHLISPRAKATEALHSLLLVRRMRAQDRLHAAMVIQKLVRWRKAFLRFSERLRLRKESDSRKDKMALLRKQYPKDVLEKEKKLALIIICNDFEYDESMPRCWETKFDDFTSLPRALESIGYKSELMLNPSRTNLLEGLQRRKQEQLAVDGMLLVHYVGIGGRGCYHQAPSIAMQLAWLQDTERSARLDVLAKQRKEMLDYDVDEQYEWNLLYDQYKADVEELERKNAKKKKKKDAQVQVIVLPTRSPRNKAQSEAFMLRWDTTLAPAVEFPQEAAQDGSTKDAAEFVCVGDSRAMLTPANTVTIREMKAILMSDQPKRGEHVIFGVDCFPFPSPQNKTTGFGALYASSGESISVEYREKQSLLLTYYLRRSILGCAVECCRVGKHDPPTHVTMEVASKYLKTKLDPTEGRFGSRRLHVEWFGEYVADMYIAHKILLKKDDRRKIKQSLLGKRTQARLELIYEGPVRSEAKLQIQQRLMQILKLTTPIDVKRLVVDDSFLIQLSQADFNTLSQHQLAAADVRAHIVNVVSEPLKCVPVKSINGVCLRVTPQQPKKPVDSSVDGEPRDLKQQAQEYFEAQERRVVEIEKRVFAPMVKFSHTTIGQFTTSTCKVHATVYFYATDDECLKIDRHCRLGFPFLPDCIAASARMMTEKETQELEHFDKLIQIEEARRQSEAKLALVREAEARKKADEEMTRMLQRKEVIVDKVQQIKGLGSIKPEDLDALIGVPLVDAMSPVVELLALIVTAANSEPLLTAGSFTKVIEAAKRIQGAFKDSRFMTACLKLMTTLSGLGPTAHPICAALLLDVIALGGPTASGAALRAMPAAIEAMHKAAISLSTTPEQMTVVATSWRSVDVDKQLSVTVLEMLNDVQCLLTDDVVDGFGIDAVMAAAPCVMSKSVNATDALTQLLRFIVARDILNEHVVSAVVAAVSLGVDSIADVDAVVHRLGVAPWSPEITAQYLSSIQKLDPTVQAQWAPLTVKLQGT
ncbi:Hypothetical protein, putative [Bodo saltans]|uniref:Uncharacterized protein n=1 Tax=Bodo saltans TaxID=75058 RepID=A0A0S4J226_BODSA|nr:Hypothetical protein, putative [Bodo saltans]|eukprot:CUG62083.1 Hypothetical protein, putative [Bodo saltans]